jgi:hypothetical protein
MLFTLLVLVVSQPAQLVGLLGIEMVSDFTDLAASVSGVENLPVDVLFGLPVVFLLGLLVIANSNHGLVAIAVWCNVVLCSGVLFYPQIVADVMGPQLARRLTAGGEQTVGEVVTLPSILSLLFLFLLYSWLVKAGKGAIGDGGQAIQPAVTEARAPGRPDRQPSGTHLFLTRATAEARATAWAQRVFASVSGCSLCLALPW